MKNLFFYALLFLTFATSCEKVESTDPTGHKISISFNINKGTIQVSPQKQIYEHGESITLKAIPKEGYAFVKWKNLPDKEKSTDEEVVIKVTSDLRLEAVFGQGTDLGEESFSIDITCEEAHGKVEILPKKDSYEKGETVKIKAIPTEGYEFSEWKGLPKGANSEKSELSFKVLADMNLTAVFAETKKHKLTVNCDAAKGTLSVTPLKDYYEEGEEVKVEVVPVEGYVFKGWTGSVVNNRTVLNLVMDQDITVNAAFEEVNETTNTDIMLQAKGWFDVKIQKWVFQVALEDKSKERSQIKDAVVTINGTQLEYSSVDYLYKGTFDKVDGLQDFEVKAVQAHIGTLKYKIDVPPVFDINNLKVEEENLKLNLEWKALNCDSYRAYRRLITDARDVFAPLLTGSSIADTKYMVTLDEFWNSDIGVSFGQRPKKGSLWVCGLNRKTELKNIHQDSYIELAGEATGDYPMSR